MKKKIFLSVMLLVIMAFGTFSVYANEEYLIAGWKDEAISGTPRRWCKRRWYRWCGWRAY